MAYIATIQVLVDVETEAEAMDAIAETMRPTMRPYNPKSCLRDWMWAKGEDEIVQVGPIPFDFQPDEEWPRAI